MFRVTSAAGLRIHELLALTAAQAEPLSAATLRCFGRGKQSERREERRKRAALHSAKVLRNARRHTRLRFHSTRPPGGRIAARATVSASCRFETRGQELAGQLPRRRPGELVGLIEARCQHTVSRRAIVARGRVIACARNQQRTERKERCQRRSFRRHQYFTQISSFAFRDVSAVTPGVPVISSEVVGLAL
jgi:hypothetical protein